MANFNLDKLNLDAQTSMFSSFALSSLFKMEITSSVDLRMYGWIKVWQQQILTCTDLANHMQIACIA